MSRLLRHPHGVGARRAAGEVHAKYGGTISEGIGNAVAGNRRPFGWPVILEVLEGIEFDFDDNGEPALSSMISDRDISKVVPQAPASVGV